MAFMHNIALNWNLGESEKPKFNLFEIIQLGTTLFCKVSPIEIKTLPTCPYVKQGANTSLHQVLQLLNHWKHKIPSQQQFKVKTSLSCKLNPNAFKLIPLAIYIKWG